MDGIAPKTKEVSNGSSLSSIKTSSGMASDVKDFRTKSAMSSVEAGYGYASDVKDKALGTSGSTESDIKDKALETSKVSTGKALAITRGPASAAPRAAPDTAAASSPIRPARPT